MNVSSLLPNGRELRIWIPTLNRAGVWIKRGESHTGHPKNVIKLAAYVQG